MYQVKTTYKKRGIRKDKYYRIFNNKTGEVIKDYIQERVAIAVNKNLNQALQGVE